MDILLERVLVFCPVVGAALGYLVDGLSGAASGFLIPVGPLLVFWVFGTRPQ